jgi:MFS family permease
MLADGASTPIWSKVSDIWGRKPILLGAVAVFFIGSTLCATAVSMTMLIVGRAIQGFGGGGLLTLSTIVISDMFSLRKRGKYYGFIGMTWAIANGIGPIMGGALTEKVSWRWCFCINRECI